MYVCMYVCMYVRTYVRMNMCMYVYMYVFMFLCLFVRVSSYLAGNPAYITVEDHCYLSALRKSEIFNYA